MQLIKGSKPEPEQDSTKQESWIRIGKRNHRIADDHHALLAELQVDCRYMSMEQLLFFTSFIGARVLRITGICTLINVDKRV
jgi:hypothetical protein